ncbi:MAG TPA: YcgN family cysteine cluster protein [Gammaproteobacteria bacterium]|nr:YcgN family cysteine cluster protein [Gammaproteobacteria bacterium]
MTEKFWETKSLAQMSAAEWESLCDGCAQCCLAKVEDVDTAAVHYTDVACRYLDSDRCRCTEYARRTELVPDCVALTPGNLAGLSWMPPTCAYRLLSERKPLPSWHPLISGDPNSVHAAGVSVRERCISEEFVHPDDVMLRIVAWHSDAAE